MRAAHTQRAAVRLAFRLAGASAGVLCVWALGMTVEESGWMPGLQEILISGLEMQGLDLHLALGLATVIWLFGCAALPLLFLSVFVPRSRMARGTHAGKRPGAPADTTASTLL